MTVGARIFEHDGVRVLDLRSEPTPESDAAIAELRRTALEQRAAVVVVSAWAGAPPDAGTPFGLCALREGAGAVIAVVGATYPEETRGVGARLWLLADDAALARRLTRYARERAAATVPHPRYRG